MTKVQKLALVTDAWEPQVNGVVRTYQMLVRMLAKRGVEVLIISPQDFKTVPLPTYPEIRLAVLPSFKTRRLLDGFQPDAIHIATEGPVGQAARRYCLKHGKAFTTSYHTRFPEYIQARLGFGLDWWWALVKKFHAKSSGIMVAAPNLLTELQKKGFPNCNLWTRGVDTTVFHPGQKSAVLRKKYKGPVMVYVGRVAVEKNIEAFLGLDIPNTKSGTKIVVGDGPQRAALEKKFPDAIFVGVKTGDDLASYYASADVFVFPSRTDTFGMVMLEAMACGTPVAAYPVQGPNDVIKSDKVGCLDDDLAKAVQKALTLKSQDCVDYVQPYSWDACADLFMKNLVALG